MAFIFFVAVFYLSADLGLQVSIVGKRKGFTHVRASKLFLMDLVLDRLNVWVATMWRPMRYNCWELHFVLFDALVLIALLSLHRWSLSLFWLFKFDVQLLLLGLLYNLHSYIARAFWQILNVLLILNLCLYILLCRTRFVISRPHRLSYLLPWATPRHWLPLFLRFGHVFVLRILLLFHWGLSLEKLTRGWHCCQTVLWRPLVLIVSRFIAGRQVIWGIVHGGKLVERLLIKGNVELL